MEYITIKNVDDQVVRKYGLEFQPGESKEISSDVLLAYSAMEISKGIQYIVSHMPRQKPKRIQTHEIIPVKTDIISDPWIVRVYKTWRDSRRWNKDLKGRLKEIKSP